MTTPQDAKARAEDARARLTAAIEKASPEAVARAARTLVESLNEKPGSSGPVVEEKR